MPGAGFFCINGLLLKFMDQRAQYLIQILEKIGSPLMTAITQVSSRGPDDGQDAQKMATLLAKTVQASIEMGNATDLARAGVQDDSVRVALAALAGPLVAEQFKSGGKIPGDAELKRIVTALQAVMTFSENFAPSKQNTARMENISADGARVDAHQIDVQYIQAFVPVVNVIGSFSFGQSEQKLIMDIAGRLVTKAAELREALAQNLSDDDQKLTELAILRALAPLYAACHTAETERLTKVRTEDQAHLSMDQLWKSFDIRVSMLETLIQNLLPKRAGSAATTSKAPAPVTAAPPTAPPVQQHAAPPPSPPAPPPQVFASPPAQQQAAPPAAAGNPMSMFAKPKADGSPPPVAPPPAQQQQQQQSSPPPAQSPPPAASQGSPMSFFKPPAKSDDE